MNFASISGEMGAESLAYSQLIIELKKKLTTFALSESAYLRCGICTTSNQGYKAYMQSLECEIFYRI